jgi:hypothetical protein
VPGTPLLERKGRSELLAALGELEARYPRV